VKIGSGLVQGQ